MEPQVTICCNKKEPKNNCLYKILDIIIILFAFVLGVIIGALTGLVEAIGAVFFYAVATILFVLGALVLVYLLCGNKRR